MPEHDDAIVRTQGAGCAHVFQVSAAQKFGPHDIDQCHPGKQQHDTQQPPEIRLHEAGQNDQQIEHRQTGPDLDKALTKEVDTAAVKALNGADDDPDNRAEDGQRKGKEHRDAEAIDDP